MDRAHLDELISIEKTYWWHIAKQKLFLELLKRECPSPARILEGGIGGANNLLTLKKLGYEVSGLDQMEAAVKRCQSLGINDVQVHDLQKPWPKAHKLYDVVVLLDVLEHCQDPAQVLSHAEKALRPGGKIIVTVPAIPFVMGPWDKALGHHRRYTVDMLRKNANAVPLKLAWCSYWNSFSVLPALVIRTIERLFIVSRNTEFPRVPNVLNSILIKLAKMERKIIHNVPIPFGLSLIGVITR